MLRTSSFTVARLRQWVYEADVSPTASPTTKDDPMRPLPIAYIYAQARPAGDDVEGGCSR